MEIASLEITCENTMFNTCKTEIFLIYFKSASIFRSVALPSTIYVYEPLPDAMKIRPGFRMFVPTAPHQEDRFIRDIAVIRYVRSVRGDLVVPHPHYYFCKKRVKF